MERYTFKMQASLWDDSRTNTPVKNRRQQWCCNYRARGWKITDTGLLPAVLKITQPPLLRNKSCPDGFRVHYSVGLQAINFFLLHCATCYIIKHNAVREMTEWQKIHKFDSTHRLSRKKVLCVWKWQRVSVITDTLFVSLRLISCLWRWHACEGYYCTGWDVFSLRMRIHTKVVLSVICKPSITPPWITEDVRE